MNYTVRSKTDREIEKVIENLIMRITLGKPPSVNSPNLKPGELVKKLPEDKRKILKKSKT